MHAITHTPQCSRLDTGSHNNKTEAVTESITATNGIFTALTHIILSKKWSNFVHITVVKYELRLLWKQKQEGLWWKE